MNKGTVTRLTLMLLAWINSALAGTAYDISWIDEETISLLVAFGFSAWAAWKDNPVTQKSVENDKYLKRKGLK